MEQPSNMNSIQPWLGRRVSYMGLELEIDELLSSEGKVKLLDEKGDGFSFHPNQFLQCVEQGYLSLSSSKRF